MLLHCKSSPLCALGSCCCPVEMGGGVHVHPSQALVGAAVGTVAGLQTLPGGSEASPVPLSAESPFSVLRKGSSHHLNDKDKNVRQRNAT